MTSALQVVRLAAASHAHAHVAQTLPSCVSGQVKKVKAGGVGTFVDQHALRHPEWAPVSVNKTPREGGESWLGLQPRWIGGASSSLLPPEDYDYEMMMMMMAAKSRPMTSN